MMNTETLSGPERNTLTPNPTESMGTQQKGDGGSGMGTGTGSTKPDPSGDNLEGNTPTRVSDEDFIKRIVSKTVQDTIKDASYSHDATNGWTNDIVETLVRSLVQIDRDNKYIGEFFVSCNLFHCFSCLSSVNG